MPLRSSARRWSKAARGVTRNRSPISRTVGGTPWRALKVRMKFRTSRCRLVNSRIRPSVEQEATQRVLSMSTKIFFGLGRLPGLAHRTFAGPFVARVGEPLEVDAVDFGNSGHPVALAPVEQARAALRAVGLAGVGHRLRGRGGHRLGHL